MKVFSSCLVCAVLPFFFVTQAYAYIDPGTGSMLIQGLLAAIAAASLTIGIFWRRLRSFFGRKNSGENGRDDS